MSIRANSLAEYLAGMRSAVTTEEPRYAAIGVVVDGDYRQLNANILQIENEYYSTIRPKPSKASKVRPLVALRRSRHRLRRGPHARFEQRRPRGHESKRAAFHRSAADLLPLGRESADLGRRAGRDRCARSQGRARRPSAGAHASWPAARERPLAATAGASCSTASAPSPELLDADAQGYVAAVDAAAEALARPRADAVGGVARGFARASKPAFSSTRLMLARSHAAYFRDFALAAAREQALVETARRSLEEAEALAGQGSAAVRGLSRGLFRPGLNGSASPPVVFCDSVNRAQGHAARILATLATRDGHEDSFPTGIRSRFRRHAGRRAFRAVARARPAAVAYLGGRQRRPCRAIPDSFAGRPDRGHRRRGRRVARARRRGRHVACRRSSSPSRCSSSTSRFAIPRAASSAWRRVIGTAAAPARRRRGRF